MGLLNQSREKLEIIIDTLHPYTAAKLKPRTYRRKARKFYLQFSKKRQSSKNVVRKAIRKQLGYVARDLGHIDSQIEEVGLEHLSNQQLRDLMVIRHIYEQQLNLYITKGKPKCKSNPHTVPNRIVSISQPHVRPIVRGKAKAAVEFGAKVSIHMVDGYAFVDYIGWDAYKVEYLREVRVSIQPMKRVC